MSLDEGAMRGTVLGDGPITVSFVESLGGKQDWCGSWFFKLRTISWHHEHGLGIYVDHKWIMLPAVCTKQRLVYLLKALGIEVPG